MNKTTRNAIQRATQDARRLLEDEYQAQLQGTFDILLNGKISPKPGDHLNATERICREKLIADIEHRETGDQKKTDAVESYLREAAFTTLNRFVALKMLEARGLVRECISKKEQSAGFKEFTGLALGMVQLSDNGYRLYIESLFDEIGREVRVLFDRQDPASLLWPRRQALNDLLDILNASDLAEVWQEDETIGWVYQYFNSEDERREMRKASQAPRNSRELAVRNQFFTPRYVVEFLTDNTLGRIWYEMRQGDTRLVDECDYLARRPNEVFLSKGEDPPEETDTNNLSQEELLNKTVYIPYRLKKDPRDLKILDPACGSGHFLLYAFDLLLTIYDEGWHDDTAPTSKSTGHTLRQDYSDINALTASLPGLILRHNLHGIDIDARATQIAAFALWMRAQRAYNETNTSRDDRPIITRTNIVVAEPMPGEKELLQEFTSALQPKVLGQLVEVVFDKMQLAGEAGSLLRIEEEIRDAIAEAKEIWQEGPKAEQLSLFGETDKSKEEQLQLFDVSGITDEQFWEEAEQQIYNTLQEYAETATAQVEYVRRLFAGDTIRGFAFIDVCQVKYDVVLMNPPFGAFTKLASRYIAPLQPNSKNDIYTAFVDRFLLQSSGVMIGAITNRTGFYANFYQKWRENVLLANCEFTCFADLGESVMDNAMVEAAAYVLHQVDVPRKSLALFVRASFPRTREQVLYTSMQDFSKGVVGSTSYLSFPHEFYRLQESPFVYWVSDSLVKRLQFMQKVEPAAGEVRNGLITGDNFRFVRALWELPGRDFTPNIFANASLDEKVRSGWVPLVLGGYSQPWYSPLTVALNWFNNGRELRAYVLKYGSESRYIRAESFYFRPGISWTGRATRFVPHAIPAGAIPTGSRLMFFPKKGLEAAFLAISSSNTASAILRFYAEKIVWPKFLAGKVKLLPWPDISNDKNLILKDFVKKKFGEVMKFYEQREPYQDFKSPPLDMVLNSLEFSEKEMIPDDLEHLICSLYELSVTEVDALTTELHLALALKEKDVEQTDNSATETLTSASEARMSYIIGCCFGRWDIRISVDSSLAPDRSDPFEPIPLCPPGMLVASDGLPATADEITSQYPLDVAWDGILVDDPGQTRDLFNSIRDAYQILFLHEFERMFQFDSENLSSEGESLREWLSLNFFSEHIGIYSISRRKAPIYWQLATPSASYSVWLYYHRFNKDIFYTVLNDYVTPKLQYEERKLTNLTQEAGPNPAKSQRKEIEMQENFIEELRVFREEVGRVAPLWNPNLNDGVIINFAPLWRLVPQNRTWQKECQKCWDKLVAGDYDWSHLSMHLWPARVVPKCATDRSLAIAHDLEEVFWEEDEDGKWHPRDVSKDEIEKLIDERTSSAVKNALNDLLSAPAPAGSRRRSRTRRT